MTAQRAAALLIAAMTLGSAAGTQAQLVAPGARPMCTTPGVPAGCAPPELAPPREPGLPAVPAPSASADEANRAAAANGAIPPLPTGDDEGDGDGEVKRPTGATPPIRPEQ